MSGIAKLGFIGLGVMGEPMCRNLAERSDLPVVAFDLRPEPLERLASVGVTAAESPIEVMEQTGLVFLSLPGGTELEAVCLADGGLLSVAKSGQVVVDCTTAPVTLTRNIADEFAEKDVGYADAPVARTRAAAEAGTLAAMVGADQDLFEKIEPYISCFASDISHVGGIGAGQLAKLMNNMVLIETIVGLSEALTIARRAGVDGGRLFETLSTGSSDSFALRNHGMKALLPGDFPSPAFSCRYALKDLTYAIDLAGENGIEVPGAETARGVLERAIDLGYGDSYYPALIHALEPSAG